MEHVFNVKTLARHIQKATGLTYLQALDTAACSAGFTNFRAMKAAKEVRPISANGLAVEFDMVDWELGQYEEETFSFSEMKESLPPKRLVSYQCRIKSDSPKSGVVVEVVPKGTDGDGQNSLALWIEINNGLPMVFVTNDIYQDQMIFCAGHKDGVVVAECEGTLIHKNQAVTPPGIAEFLQEKAVYANAWVIENKNYDDDPAA